MNALVETCHIADKETARIAELELHRRFPNLRALVLADADGCLSDATFSEFALATLAQMKELVCLNLAACRSLTTSSACALAVSGRGLETLHMPAYGEGDSVFSGSAAALDLARHALLPPP